MVDENDYPVEGSEVLLKTIHGIQTTITDANGNFLYSNVTVVKEGALLKVCQSGKFEAFRNMSLTQNSYNYTKIKLLDKNVIGSIPSMEGGEIQDISRPAKIALAPNSVRYQNGEDYTGSVDIAMSWIDPTAEDLAERIVGDLSGIDKDGKQMALGTFGMLNVQLLGENGKELQLKEGMSTTLSFPVPDGILAKAPSMIPLWSYNEEAGTWIEEGSAIWQDGFYVGEVAHFSSWNVDTKTDPISVSGNVFVRVNEEDKQVPYLQVYVSIEGVRQAGGFLDDSGEFEFYNFPANTAFTLTILDACGAILWEEELGPYASDTELETIVVQSTDSNFVTISGSGVDCEGILLEDGDVKFELNGVFSFYPLQENGTYEFVVNVCEASQGRLSIIDFKNGRTSFAETVEFSNPSIAVSPLVVCNELDAYMNIIDSEIWGAIYLTNTRASINDENTLTVSAWDNYDFFSASFFIQNFEGIGVYEDIFFNLAETDALAAYSVTVEITKFGKNSGDVVVGSFFDENINPQTGEITYPIRGTFKAIVQ